MDILHIDDNKEICDFYTEVFLSKKHSFTSVNDGLKGLGLIAKNSYDFILLDMYMPDYNGAKFLRDLKKIRASELKNVVVVSMLDFNNSQVNELLKFGINSVMKKPINLKEIEEFEKDLLQIKNAITA